MAEPLFDDVIHAPLRLRICSLLAAADTVAFGVVRDTLGITDAHLSKQVKILSGAGYMATSKACSSNRGDARKTMWLSLTKHGRHAFESHVRALREILRDV